MRSSPVAVLTNSQSIVAQPDSRGELDRSTLANWVGGAVWWLEPLQARLAEHVFASQTLFADDTPIPVLDPGRGRTKTGRLRVYARDDRPCRGQPIRPCAPPERFA